MQVSVVF